MKKIKVLHLQLLPLLSGVQNMMIQLLKGMDPNEFEIFVVSKGDGPLVDEVEKNGWTHITLDYLVREISFKDFKAMIGFYKILKMINPDIVHTHSSKTGFIGRIIARIAGIKLIIHTLHGFSFHPYQNFTTRVFYQLLESFAAMFAHYNVFVNQYEKEFAIHKLGFNPAKSLTIYNGINAYNKIREYPESFNFIENSLNIVSVSRFSEQKNIVSTIEQAIDIVNMYENINFTFYGDGELYGLCQKIIKQNKAQDKIFLPGWAKDIQEILLGYDVFLLNSLWEGLPISILEAMSVGLPVIASNIKGNNELVDESNGWLIKPYDLKGLQKVVEQIMLNPEDIALKGKQSLKKVTYIFQEELFINRYVELYKKRFTKENADVVNER